VEFDREEKGLGYGHEKMETKATKKTEEGSEHTRRARCRRKKYGNWTCVQIHF